MMSSLTQQAEPRKAQTIALVPIGQVNEAVLTAIGEGLKEAFGLDYIIVSSLPHPDYAYERRRGQYRSDDILARLCHLSLPAERWLGVADVDLYAPGLNFVFGQANMGGPAALISLARLQQRFYGLRDDQGLFFERAIKEAVHELGHTYGLGHCSNRRCVMAFSNSLADTDYKGRGFCPRCRLALQGIIK